MKLKNTQMDKIIITITMERQKNGTVKRKTDLQGEGFHFFELVGLLQLTCYDLAKQSTDTAKVVPKDKETRIVFGGTEEKLKDAL